MKRSPFCAYSCPICLLLYPSCVLVDFNRRFLLSFCLNPCPLSYPADILVLIVYLILRVYYKQWQFMKPVNAMNYTSLFEARWIDSWADGIISEFSEWSSQGFLRVGAVDELGDASCWMLMQCCETFILWVKVYEHWDHLGWLYC